MKMRQPDTRNRDEIAAKMELTHPKRFKWIQDEGPRAKAVLEEYPRLVDFQGAMVRFPSLF